LVEPITMVGLLVDALVEAPDVAAGTAKVVARVARAAMASNRGRRMGTAFLSEATLHGLSRQDCNKKVRRSKS